MSSIKLTVQNIKCGGCVANIINGLSPMEGIDSVEVDQESGVVQIIGTNLDKSTITDKLSELGYPEGGS